MIVPLGNRVLLRRIKLEESVGGIILPDSAKTKSQRAVVVHAPFESKDVVEGDVVIVSQYGGSPVKLDGEELLLVDIDSLLAKEVA